MSSPILSVVIPTYNRRAVLEKCLQALCEQTVPASQFEIIVVDDGSTDETEPFVVQFARNAPVAVYYLRQSNRGPAAARNLGIAKARSSLVLFLGDDIIAASELVAEHLQYHANRLGETVAVLGFVTWSPELPMTPFMRWLEQGKGPQFAYEIVARQAENVPYKYLNTANVSISKKTLMEVGLFDEEFRYAAQEDVELGFRLNRHGIRIVYAPSAIAYHLHPTTPAQACRRHVEIGIATTILCRKLGSPILIPDSYIRRALRRLVYAKPSLNLLKWLATVVPSAVVWRLALEAHVRAGFHMGLALPSIPTLASAEEDMVRCLRV